MINKPDSSDFVLWQRSPCTQWLLEHVDARFNHDRDWIGARDMNTLNLMRGNQEVVDFIRKEIT